LTLGRVGDQHVPAERFEAVVHEPRTGHRLDHRAHRPLVTPHPARQAKQAVGVRRRRELLDDLASRRQQADIDLAATQIQSSVQHERGPPRARSSVNTPSVPPGRPSFMAVQSSGAKESGPGYTLLVGNSQGVPMSEQQQEQQTPESPSERPPSDPDQHQEGAPEADPTTPGVESPPNEQEGSDA
jgi:hypothetical protein